MQILFEPTSVKSYLVSADWTPPEMNPVGVRNIVFTFGTVRLKSAMMPYTQISFNDFGRMFDEFDESRASRAYLVWCAITATDPDFAAYDAAAFGWDSEWYERLQPIRDYLFPEIASNDGSEQAGPLLEFHIDDGFSDTGSSLERIRGYLFTSGLLPDNFVTIQVTERFRYAPYTEDNRIGGEIRWVHVTPEMVSYNIQKVMQFKAVS